MGDVETPDQDQDDDNEHRHGHGHENGEDNNKQARRMTKDGSGREAGAAAPGVTAPGAAEYATAAGPKARWEYLAPERVQARLYDIVPTMAAPQATSINAFAATPDMRFWMTGGTDGYVRKYDGVGTINGKQLLTVAQRHPFVDSVVKAGILMSYWENEEQPGAAGGGSGGAGAGAGAASGAGAGAGAGSAADHILSPVYSLAVHSQGLWVLSGTEGGAINLSSARHDEGKRIACLAKHSSAVSVLTMLPGEKSVLSGSWDKTIADWDLDTGKVRRRFEGSGGQISAVELRPSGGALIPQAASYGTDLLGPRPDAGSATISGNNDQPFRNGGSAGLTNGVHGGQMVNGSGGGSAEGAGSGFAQSASPAHESLFGSPAGSLFGEDNMGADGNGNVFGDDDDDFGDMDLNGGGGGQGSDVAMGDTDAGAGGVAKGAGASGKGSGGKSKAGANNNINGVASSSSSSSHTSTVVGNSQQQTAAGPEQDMPAAAAEPARTTSSPKQPRRQSQAGSMVLTSAATPHVDATQASDQIFAAASMDGTIRIWDRRMQGAAARIGLRPGLPPWCMGACWSPDGNHIYAGRRNGTVEEYSIHKARAGWLPERALKLPAGSGPVSCVRPMPNGRHLVVASHDILRLYDLRDSSAFKGSSVPFLIIPGPPRAGVISQLYIDPTARFMVSTAGTRGWDGSSTETLVGYEINVAN